MSNTVDLNTALRDHQWLRRVQIHTVGARFPRGFREMDQVEQAREAGLRHRSYSKMRSELAFLLRMYLEPILMSRAPEGEHAIELLNLIRVLNLPAAGWHRFKSRRKEVFSKAIQELQGMKAVVGRGIDVEIRQGLNQRDFMLVARLLSNEMLQEMVLAAGAAAPKHFT